MHVFNIMQNIGDMSSLKGFFIRGGFSMSLFWSMAIVALILSLVVK